MPHDIISLSSDDDDFGTLARPSASARSPSPPPSQPSPLESLSRVSSSTGGAGTKKARVTTKRGRGEAIVGAAAVAAKRPRKTAPVIVRHRQGAPDAATLFERYRPKRMGDLATSGVRNTAITAWLQGSARPSPRSRVLFLHGRPGSGKASLVRVAAESLGLSLREWVAVENRALDAVDYHENTSQLQYFRRALLHDRAFSRDVVGADTESKVLVFHGLPHCHTLAQQKERADVLRQFVKELKEPSHGLEYPVVILYTSYATHSQNYQLHEDFPNEFLACPQIEKVEIHNVTQHALRKRLKHIATAECATQKAAAAAVDEVMLHVEGDIRQALHTLAFTLIPPEPRGPISPDLVAPPAMLQRALGVPEVTDGSDYRDNRAVIDIAHAAARVLAAKREEEGAGPLCHSLDETLAIVGVGADKLTDYVHHSLPRYCQVEGGLEKLAAVTRNVSDANVYGTLLSSQDRASGWTSRCLFGWSLQKYTQAPEPSRSKSFEACHPPPVCVPAHELTVLRRTMESATSDEMASSHSSGQLGLEVWPMVRSIVFQRRQQSLFQPAPAARAAPPAAAAQQQQQRLVPSPSKPVPFTGKPVPFGQPAKPVPFVAKPVPFTGKPVPFERPVPFGAVVAKPRVPPPPPVLLTQAQLQALKALCHYSRGQWQRPTMVDVRAAIALKWNRPQPNPVTPDEIRDRRVWVAEQHSDGEIVDGKEVASDPICDDW